MSKDQFLFYWTCSHPIFPATSILKKKQPSQNLKRRTSPSNDKTTSITPKKYQWRASTLHKPPKKYKKKSWISHKLFQKRVPSTTTGSVRQLKYLKKCPPINIQIQSLSVHNTKEPLLPKTTLLMTKKDKARVMST